MLRAAEPFKTAENSVDILRPEVKQAGHAEQGDQRRHDRNEPVIGHTPGCHGAAVLNELAQRVHVEVAPTAAPHRACQRAEWCTLRLRMALLAGSDLQQP